MIELFGTMKKIIGDLKTALQLLQYFGHLIKELLHKMISGQQEILPLCNSLNEYYADSLIKATFFNHSFSGVNSN